MKIKITIKDRAWIDKKFVNAKLKNLYSYTFKGKEFDDTTKKWEEVDKFLNNFFEDPFSDLIGFPCGDIDKLVSHFGRNEVEIEDRRSISSLGLAEPLKLNVSVTQDKRWVAQSQLMDDWLKKGNGVIKAPPASGKSIMAIGLICKLQVKTLCVFHQSNFRNQWMKELRKFTNIDKLEDLSKKQIAGIYDGGDIFPITFTTVQKLISKKEEEDLGKFKKQFGLVVVDEVHHAASPSFCYVLSNTHARFSLGLTATPKRKDKLEGVYFDSIGPLTAEGGSEQLLPEVRLHYTGVRVTRNFYVSEWAQWGMFLNQLAKNQERNNMICKLIKEEVRKENRYVLVISERVNHCHVLENLLLESYGFHQTEIQVITGQTKKQEELFANARNRQYKVLICSKVMDEGVDIPPLDTLHYATPLASKAKIEQRAGRIRRPCEGKQSPRIHDWIDTGPGQIHGAAKVRQGVYKAIGATILSEEEGNIDHNTGLPKYNRSK